MMEPVGKLSEAVGKLSEAVAQQAEETRQWQRDSFPQDPVLLYRINLRSIDGEILPSLFAVPKQDLLNVTHAPEAVFFDVIQGDQIQEMAFFGMSIIITKVVMCSFEDVRNYPTLTMVDEDRRAIRASKVFLGLTGLMR